MPANADLDRHIAEALQAATVPGLATACLEDGVVSAAHTVGLTTSGVPVGPTTLFQAASLSKPLFAYVVLALCEQRVLTLDTPLGAYWTDPYVDDPRLLTLTARHVLSHTTGLPNWREGDRLRMEAVPGARFGYSGEAFEYLQRVIEHLTGQPLHVLMPPLLATLGMQHSTFAWTVNEAGNVLLDAAHTAVLPATRGHVHASAAYSLLTTATDYAHFVGALLAPQHTPALLGPAAVATMLTPQTLVGRWAHLAWGLGWGLQQTEEGAAFWHWGGAQNGYTAYAVGVPETRRGLVILTNGEDGLPVCAEIARRVLGHTRQHPAFAWLLPLADWRPTGD